MKKFLALSVLTVAAMAVSLQPASAWTNIKFGAGVNLNWQSGDNNFFWGLFRNGQVPPPAGYIGGYPGQVPYGPHGVQGLPYGAAPQGMYAPELGQGQMAPVPQAQGNGVAPTQAPVSVRPAAYQYGNYGYQPIGYFYPAANYNTYQLPMHSYPTQAPSYWYGY